MTFLSRITFALVAMAFAGCTAAAQDITENVSRGPRFLVVTPSGSAVAVDIARTPVLIRRIALDLQHVSRKDALATISERAGIRIFYADRLIAGTSAVSLRADGITVAAALTDVLADLDIDVVFSAPGTATLVARGRGMALVALGMISGRVIDSVTKEALSGAAVVVDGTRLTATTGQDGSFTLRDVPAGTQHVSVRRLGYKTQSRAVTVAENARIVTDFVLGRAPTQLTEIVVTPTGDRQRLEVGNAIGTIKADSVVQLSLIRNMSDLLQARTPGVIVSNTSGLVGSPSKVRIRGINSISLNNDPIIIVDGVRYLAQTTAASSQTNVGASVIASTAASLNTEFATRQAAPSRLDDIDPNIIESVDVLRGPSAATLYGTDAANGVIVIKTKRGAAGVWRSQAILDQGWSYLSGRMPEIWSAWGPRVIGATTRTCLLANNLAGVENLESGDCSQDSLTHFHPQNDARMRTLGTGENRSASVSVSGGSETLKQFLSVRAANLIGMAKMSDLERNRIARTWNSPPPSWMVRPNTERDIDGSSRSNLRLGRGLDLFITATGGYRDVLNGGAALATTALVGSILAAWSPSDTIRYQPSEAQRTKQTSTVKRGTLAVGATYTPGAWLSFRAVMGGDYVGRSDDGLLRASDCTPTLARINVNLVCRSGRNVVREEVFVRTADIGVQFSFDVRSWLVSRSSIGQQFSGTSFTSLSAGNTASTDLAFGTDLLSPAPVATSGTPQIYAVGEVRDQAATAGRYVEQTFAVRERLFVTAAVRQDVASAFGANVNANPPLYPKLGASWLLSDESFYPRNRFMPTLRLRAALGHSGNQASQTSTLNNFRLTQTIVDGVASPAIQLTQLGNTNLRPERTTEVEGGFDVSFRDDDRFRGEVTLYRKLSEDAITSVSLPPSYGVGYFDGASPLMSNLTRAANIGSVENRGVELSATGRLMDIPQYSWDLTINWTRNRNTLVRKDSALSSSGPLSTQFREGYPIYGYWGYPVLSYGDNNADGILQSTEITFGPRAFLGAPYPRDQFMYANVISLWRGTIRLGVNMDHTLGLANNRQVSATVTTRCTLDRTCTIAQQAAAVQALLQGGFMGETSTLRVGEVSVTYNAPSVLLAKTRMVRSLAVTVAGRNLAVHTNYAGKDPNVDTSGALGDATADNGTGVPQPRMWTVRLNLGF